MEQKEILQKVYKAQMTMSEAQTFLGISREVLRQLLRKEFKVSRNTHIYSTKDGFVRRDDKEYWSKVYLAYQKGKSVNDFLREHGWSADQMTAQFKLYGWSQRDKKAQLLLRQEKIEKTVRERYGVDNVAKMPDFGERYKKTSLKKYGVEHPLQNSAILAKQQRTNKERYGVNHPGSSPELMEKVKQTNLLRYGVENPQQNPGVRRRSEETNLSRYGSISPLGSAEIRQKMIENIRKEKVKLIIPKLAQYGYVLLDEYEKLYDRSDDGEFLGWRKYKIRHDKCGKEFEDDVFMMPRCPNCYPLYGSHTSHQQEFYLNFVSVIKPKVESGRRDIIMNPKTSRYFEMDIYLQAEKIAFEFNSLYYHAIHVNPRSSKESYVIKEPLYHQLKSDAALTKGIRLYHIWEHHNPEIVKSKISQILGQPQNRIGARKTQLFDVSHSDAELFMDTNHLYGSTVAFAAFGLQFQDELIALITYRRTQEPTTVEIARFATKIGFSVPGGFSRLLSYSLPLVKQLIPEAKTLITYADRDWSPDPTQTVYAKTGFRFLGDTGPSLYYTDFKQVWSRQTYQKHKLAQLFPDTFDPSLTEQQILSLNGIYPLYTSGNWKFTKVIVS